MLSGVARLVFAQGPRGPDGPPGELGPEGIKVTSWYRYSRKLTLIPVC